MSVLNQQNINNNAQQKLAGRAIGNAHHRQQQQQQQQQQDVYSHTVFILFNRN